VKAPPQIIIIIIKRQGKQQTATAAVTLVPGKIEPQ
jgi:hypothetical protein